MFKLRLLVFCLLLLSVLRMSYASDVTIEEAMIVSQEFIVKSSKDCKIKDVKLVESNEKLLFYYVEIFPIGYIVVSGDKDLWPVISYSFVNNLESDGAMMSFLKYDVKTRISVVDDLPESVLSERHQMWSDALSQNLNDVKLFQQWPLEGTTSTEGWLESNWTQTSPYNQMCPIDPVTFGRSYVGCPATAMGMILNYHQTTNATQFSDSDDYYHSYAGRNYSIDDDFLANGFPSFEDLNKHLDTLNNHWQQHIEITNNDKAALSFACGVAAHQVFTSEASGTFEVAQALDAYHRFACTSASLYLEDDEDLFPVLISNMKNAYPAHLALVDEAWSTGHNIVVDGYNTDNYFHVNFGWAGSNNGWYLLPDEMPYSLTVIEGIILNILNENVVVENESSNFGFNVYPNPTNTSFKINCQEKFLGEIELVEMYNNLGQLTYCDSFEENKTIYTSEIGGVGVYYLHLIDKNGNSRSVEKIIVNE